MAKRKQKRKRVGRYVPFLETLDRISDNSGCEWNDHSKLNIMSEFLSAVANRKQGLLSRFIRFVQKRADRETKPYGACAKCDTALEEDTSNSLCSDCEE